ncbi:hypothetical protein HK096_004509 [Nowakowskiella sp. JEL0078]|nr:hypothetical protein HK096_004509 [Nowakowskiella sp. JEL0078]
MGTRSQSKHSRIMQSNSDLIHGATLFSPYDQAQQSLLIHTLPQNRYQVPISQTNFYANLPTIANRKSISCDFSHSSNFPTGMSLDKENHVLEKQANQKYIGYTSYCRGKDEFLADESDHSNEDEMENDQNNVSDSGTSENADFGEIPKCVLDQDEKTFYEQHGNDEDQPDKNTDKYTDDFEEEAPEFSIKTKISNELTHKNEHKFHEDLEVSTDEEITAQGSQTVATIVSIQHPENNTAQEEKISEEDELKKRDEEFEREAEWFKSFSYGLKWDAVKRKHGFQHILVRLIESINFQEKFSDEKYEYRNIKLPRKLLGVMPDFFYEGRLLSQKEIYSIGIRQSAGWSHYEIHKPEPHVLLFRRPIRKGNADNIDNFAEHQKLKDKDLVNGNFEALIKEDFDKENDQEENCEVEVEDQDAMPAYEQSETIKKHSKFENEIEKKLKSDTENLPHRFKKETQPNKKVENLHRAALNNIVRSSRYSNHSHHSKKVLDFLNLQEPNCAGDCFENSAADFNWTEEYFGAIRKFHSCYLDILRLEKVHADKTYSISKEKNTDNFCENTDTDKAYQISEEQNLETFKRNTKGNYQRESSSNSELSVTSKPSIREQKISEKTFVNNQQFHQRLSLDSQDLRKRLGLTRESKRKNDESSSSPGQKRPRKRQSLS